jgi:hypothetical protein
MSKGVLSMKKKLKTRMRGALLRWFRAGRMSDEDARKRGYDPDAVRKNHKMLRFKEEVGSNKTEEQ